MNFIPELKFKEIAEDTNEKEKERKLADQAKWQKFFSLHVVNYFDEHSFRSFHKEFNPVKDKLDCFIPSCGRFKCGEKGKTIVPGRRKRKKKTKTPLELEREEKLKEGGIEQGEKSQDEGCGKKKTKTPLELEREEKLKEGGTEQGEKSQDEGCGKKIKTPLELERAEKLKEGGTEQGEKSLDEGCGKRWNSNRCLTKLVCSIEGKNKLVVEVREYGQRCGRCTHRYENPSFTDHDLDIMIEWSLKMILEGMFGVIDESIDVNPADMGYFHRRRTNRSKQTTHEAAICQACIENKNCGVRRKRRKQKKRKKQNQTSSNAQSQPSTSSSS